MYKQIFDEPIYLDSPDHVVPLHTLSDPSDLYTFCRNNNIHYFGYGIRYTRSSYDTKQMKFGMSAPNPHTRGKPKGERLVRQVGLLPGWNKLLNSSTGVDFWMGCQKLINKNILPPNITYSDFEVAIWTGNTRKNISGLEMSYKDIASHIESELCYQYFVRHKELPLLNIADPTKNKKFIAKAKTTFLDLFTVSA